MRRSSLALLLLAAPHREAHADDEARPPAPLACLQRYYAVTASRRPDGAWEARLPDGRVVPWDDGKPKSFDEKLEHPDLEDAFSIPYRAGAIRPVTVENDDPGRIRIDPLFQATYPTGARDLTRIEFFGRNLTVHKKVAEPLRRVADRLARAVAADPSIRPFLDGLGGTLVKRNIAGTDRPSAHSYGVSLDLNPKRSEYWRWQRPPAPLKWRNHAPQAIVDAFEAEGFIWGGRWYHYDTMHFEYRPELLDPACQPKEKR